MSEQTTNPRGELAVVLARVAHSAADAGKTRHDIGLLLLDAIERAPAVSLAYDWRSASLAAISHLDAALDVPAPVVQALLKLKAALAEPDAVGRAAIGATGDRLTDSKALGIIARDGYRHTGFVLSSDAADREKCIIDLSAVRWLDADSFWKIMHPTPTGALSSEDGDDTLISAKKVYAAITSLANEEPDPEHPVSKERIDAWTGALEQVRDAIGEIEGEVISALESASATAPSIVSPAGSTVRVNLSQAQQLVDFFGGEEGDAVLCQSDRGHSGPGLYAWIEDHPEEGASVLSPEAPATGERTAPL